MAATRLVTVQDFYSNILYQLEGEPTSTLIRAFIASEMVLNPSWAVSTLDQGEKNDVLRRLTGCTVATDTALNCYPRGYDTTLCFDLDGEEVP